MWVYSLTHEEEDERVTQLYCGGRMQEVRQRYSDPDEVEIVIEDWKQPLPDGTLIKVGNGIQYSNPLFNVNQYYSNRTPAKLDFPAPALGDDTAIHPDVIDFYNEIGRSWNGYRFWMIYTPLPVTNPNDHEVPCVLASNDKVTWVIPEGGSNPITTHAQVTYMADPTLFYEKSTNKLWAIYLNYTNKRVEARTTTNGITWSSQITMHTLIDTTELISPSIIKVGNEFRMYGVDAVVENPNKHVYYLTSNSLTGTWIQGNDVVFDASNCALGLHFTGDLSDYWQPWHINIIKCYDFYLMQLYPRLNQNNSQAYRELNQMWFAVSSDGINFKISKYPLFQQNNNGALTGRFPNTAYWDNAMYRFAVTPEIVDNKLAFNCWYSGWGGGYDVYPVYVGYCLIKNFDAYVIGDANTSNAFNAAINDAEMAKAIAKQDGYVLGDTFRNRTILQADGFGLGVSESGYTYQYGANNYFEVKDGYVWSKYFSPVPEIFIDMCINYEWTIDLFFSAANCLYYLKYIDANNYIIWYPASKRIGIRNAGVSVYLNPLIFRFNITEINRFKFVFNGAHLQVFVNEVLNFEYTLTVANFDNQGQMDTMLASTKKGYYSQNNTTRFYGMKLKQL